MSILTIFLLGLDILCILASVVVLLVFMIIGLVKVIQKLPAKKIFINGLIYFVCCLLGSVVVTWLLKLLLLSRV